jgi:hypothetical protein
MTDTTPSINLDQIYADAELRLEAISKEAAQQDEIITNAKATKTALSQEAAGLERLLKSRTPRTVNRQSKAAKSEPPAKRGPAVTTDANDEPV